MRQHNHDNRDPDILKISQADVSNPAQDETKKDGQSQIGLLVSAYSRGKDGAGECSNATSSHEKTHAKEGSAIGFEAREWQRIDAHSHYGKEHP